MRLVQPRKVLAFAFWELRRILCAISDDGWADWRAMGLLVCTQIGLVLNIFALASVISGHRLIPTHGIELTAFAVSLSVVITATNYYAVRFENRWKHFEREFERYPKLIQRLGCVVMIALPLLTAAAMVWSAATMARLPP